MKLSFLFVIAVLAVADFAHAHHGWTHYDASQTLTLSGKVTETGYEHPHGYVKLDAGDNQAWLVILAPPSRMERRGLAREAIAVGATVTVVGYPHRETAGELRAERITAGGTTVELR